MSGRFAFGPGGNGSTSAKILFDCRHYRGNRPCRPNKQHGAVCGLCEDYEPTNQRILIIKLDALGDVLRFASLVPPLRARHPRAKIYWLTRAGAVSMVELVQGVDRVLTFDAEGLEIARSIRWDLVYNLSNDEPSAAAAAGMNADCKIGYVLSEKGDITPTNRAARRWLEMASFDQLKQKNKRSYQELMYAIAGFSSKVARPPLRRPDLEEKLFTPPLGEARGIGPLIGINVGAGSRWPKKMFRSRSTISVARRILSLREDATIVLLGGESEKAGLAEIHGALCEFGRVTRCTGDQTIPQFAAMIASLDALLTGDSLALHLATAYKVPAVALFGPTSHTEIHPYDGLISKAYAPDLDCLCCYSDCSKSRHCMNSLDLDEIASLLVNRVPETAVVE